MKPGYKRTEVGVIPEAWEVKRLDEVADFLDGMRRPVKDSDRAKMRGEVPYYGASGIVDYVNGFLFDEDLVLLAEDGENIVSRTSRIAFQISGRTWVNNHAHVLRPKPGMVIGYLVEALESRDYDQHNTGTAQPKLNKQVCSKLPILCPSLPEQRAIAQALSDADALIAALEKLIAKKRDVKQAVMQQLLSGRTRLPGFSGAWERHKLGDVSEIIMGQSPPGHSYNRTGMGVPLINGPTEFTDKHPVKIQWTTEPTKFCEKGDLLICVRGSSTGRTNTSDDDYCIGRGVAAIRAKANSSTVYIAYQVIGAIETILTATTGSTFPSIDGKSIRAIEIPLPTQAEQTAIATALSDMDAEIVALEARLAKTRALKQGMAQALLTGRVRLV